MPTLFLNAFRWTKLANLLIRNLPPPIGFSYCDPAGPSGDGYSCGPWNDTSVAKHSALFLKTWLTEEGYFPELRSRPLFLVGESYAGIYVPGFAQAMLDDPVPGLNFRGFAVGDGFPGCRRISGRPVDWCIDLDNVGLFKYPNANPGAPDGLHDCPAPRRRCERTCG